MPTLYPDNQNRETRLHQLYSDAQGFLSDAKGDYQTFVTLNASVNRNLAAVYSKAGLASPQVTTVEIVNAGKAANTANDIVSDIDMADIVIDLGASAAPVAFAPAATLYLVDTGAITAETAGTVLATTLGTDITVGTLFGGIVGALVVGVVAGGLSLAINAVEGSEIRDELRTGIRKMKGLRLAAATSKYQCATFVVMMTSVETTCKTLQSSNIPMTDTIIRNLIAKDAEPATKALATFTRKFVLGNLYDLDIGRKSWINEG